MATAQSYSNTSVEKGIRSGRITVVNQKLSAHSSVWADFGVPLLSESDGENDQDQSLIDGFAVCKHCNKAFSYSSSSGVSHLKRHIQQSCKSKNRAIKNQPKIEASLEKSLPQAESQRLTENFVDFVCRDIRPFYAVEGEGFRNLCKSLVSIGSKYGTVNIESVIPSRQTVANRVIQRSQEVMADMAELLVPLAEKSRVAVTTDLWTDKYKKITYLDISCYWIDDNFELSSQTVYCGHFKPERKTGENIYREIVTFFDGLLITESNIAEKIVFTTDCGSNIIAALKNSQRMNCANHRLNSLLRESWSRATDIDPLLEQFLEKCRELVRYAKKSNLQSELDITLKAESATRWNSLYFVFHSVSVNYDDIKRKLAGTQQFDKIACIDANLLKELSQFLGDIWEVSNKLQHEKEPTLQFVPMAYEHLVDLCRPKPTDSSPLQHLKNCISANQDKYFKPQLLHYVACFLDPSTKSLENVIPNDENRSRIQNSIREYLVTKMGDMEVERGFTLPNVESSTDNIVPPTKKGRTDIFARFRKSNVPMFIDSTVEVELASYISLAETSSEILPFWKQNRQQFPRLSELAARVYRIPASSAASERSFSTAGRVMEQRRCRLKPKTANAILVVHSHLKRTLA